MARFKPGQKVICTKPRNHFWPNDDGSIKGVCGYGPQSDEEVTVDHYAHDYPDGCCFIEYPLSTNGERYYYNDVLFEPSISLTELTEILESVPESV